MTAALGLGRQFYGLGVSLGLDDVIEHPLRDRGWVFWSTEWRIECLNMDAQDRLAVVADSAPVGFVQPGGEPIRATFQGEAGVRVACGPLDNAQGQRLLKSMGFDEGSSRRERYHRLGRCVECLDSQQYRAYLGWKNVR